MKDTFKHTRNIDLGIIKLLKEKHVEKVIEQLEKSVHNVNERYKEKLNTPNIIHTYAEHTKWRLIQLKILKKNGVNWTITERIKQEMFKDRIERGEYLQQEKKYLKLIK
jgi:hypothetical protein